MNPARIARLGGPVLVVLLLGVGFGWLPARSASSAAEARTGSALRIVDDLTWELDDLDAIASTVDDLRAEQLDFQAAVPPDHQLAEFILDLEALSHEVGIDVVDVVPTSILGSFDDLATPPGTSSVVVSVALSGSFAATIQYLDGLSGLSRLVVAEAIAIGVDEVTGTLAVDLELRVFTTKELVEFTDEFLDDAEDDPSLDDAKDDPSLDDVEDDRALDEDPSLDEEVFE